jgi:hypothetical protein
MHPITNLSADLTATVSRGLTQRTHQEASVFGPRHAELPQGNHGWMRWFQTGPGFDDGYWQALAPEAGAVQ